MCRACRERRASRVSRESLGRRVLLGSRDCSRRRGLRWRRPESVSWGVFRPGVAWGETYVDGDGAGGDEERDGDEGEEACDAHLGC